MRWPSDSAATAPHLQPGQFSVRAGPVMRRPTLGSALNLTRLPITDDDWTEDHLCGRDMLHGAGAGCARDGVDRLLPAETKVAANGALRCPTVERPTTERRFLWPDVPRAGIPGYFRLYAGIPVRDVCTLT